MAGQLSAKRIARRPIPFAESTGQILCYNWTNTVNGVLGGPGLIGPEPTKAAGDAVVWKILKFRTKFAMGRRVHGTVHTGSFGTLNAGMENWIVRAHIGGE